MASFDTAFWGTNCVGHHVITENCKKGLRGSNEFQEFLRESVQIEEAKSKESQRLAKYFQSDFGIHNTLFSVMRKHVNSLDSAQLQTVEELKQLREKVREADDGGKRQTQLIKDSPLHKLAATLSQSQAAANKPAKKVGRKGSLPNIANNDVQGKYNKDVLAYEAAMEEYCQTMQTLEMENSSRMNDYIRQFASLLQAYHNRCLAVISTLSNELQEKDALYCCKHLIAATGTGSERPSQRMGKIVVEDEIKTSAVVVPENPANEAKAKLPSANELPEEGKGPRFPGLVKKGLRKMSNKAHVNRAPVTSLRSVPSNEKGLSSSASPPGQPQSTILDNSLHEEVEIDNDSYRVKMTETADDKSDSSTSSSDEEEGEEKPRRFVVKIRDKADIQVQEADVESYRLEAEPQQPMRLRSQRQAGMGIGRNPANQQLAEEQGPGENETGQPNIKGHEAGHWSSTAIGQSDATIDSPIAFKASPAGFAAEGTGMKGVVVGRMAIMETINAYFKGRHLVKAVLSGKVSLSLPKSILCDLQPDSPPIVLEAEGMDSLSSTEYSPDLDVTVMGGSVVIKASALLSCLQKATPDSAAGDIRMTLLQYTVTGTDLSFVPLRLCSVWHCLPGRTDLTQHYLCNDTVLKVPLVETRLGFQLAGARASEVQSTPQGVWNGEGPQRLQWNLGTVSLDGPEKGKGQLSASFVVDGTSTPSKVLANFHGIGQTLSRFSIRTLPSSSVQLGTPIKHFAAGKYIADV